MANPRIPFRLTAERLKLPPMEGKRILVHLVVSVAPACQSVRHGAQFSEVEYGLRTGLPRLLAAIGDLPASTGINAQLIDTSPQAAIALRDAGWEFIGHDMAPAATRDLEGREAERVQDCLEKIADFTGTSPRGWLSPGSQETPETLDALAAAGLDYVCNTGWDDVPAWIDTPSARLLALPSHHHITDSIIYGREHQASGEMVRRVQHTLAQFEAEDGVRVLGIGLHPHVIGLPHRIHELHAMIKALAASRTTLFTTGSALCDWFAAVSGE
jgi:peptidoglycan/xylan/chitin deacetylase (PgdA/CDA1 family)